MLKNILAFITFIILVFIYMNIRPNLSTNKSEGVINDQGFVILSTGQQINPINPDSSIFKSSKKVKVENYNDGDANSWVIVDFVRTKELNYLFALFVFLAIMVGGIWGYFSLLGMLASYFVIFNFILPRIISGQDPVVVAITGSLIIAPVTFYLSHGVNTKTNIAIVSTLLSLIFTGILANFFIKLTMLTGFNSEEAMFLQSELFGQINLRGVLLAGIIISTMGILDDITISQASIVQELKKANSKYGFNKLFAGAMNIGRDHIASLINTLVLVYTGSALPLLLLFTNSQKSIIDVINTEMIATEIVKTLVGSIGLILAVPISSALAAYYFSNSKRVNFSFNHFFKN